MAEVDKALTDKLASTVAPSEARDLAAYKRVRRPRHGSCKAIGRGLCLRSRAIPPRAARSPASQPPPRAEG